MYWNSEVLTLWQATTINWKSEEKNLCAKHPRANANDEGDFDGDIGSFFHYFTIAEDMLSVRLDPHVHVHSHCNSTLRMENPS